MRQRLVFAVVVLAFLVGMASLIPTPSVYAGSNGQQLWFQKATNSGAQGIAWIRVYGTNQNGQSVSWYREFNPLVNEYRLSNWWWKGSLYVDYGVRYPDGRRVYNGCSLSIPTSMSGDWVRILIDVRSSSPGCTKG